MCLPAILVGRSISSCFDIYINQTGNYSQYMSMNFPNMYALLIKPIEIGNLISSVDNSLSIYYIMFALAIFVIIAIIMMHKEIELDKKTIINLSLWSIITCTFFLPCMHDRYMYMADVLYI